MKEADLYEKREERKVRCFLCAHRCVISDGRRGVCGVRENRGGALYTDTYGRLIAQHLDPIEKKPLYHFLPGSDSLSIAAIGCNFQCGFCQNWQISQVKRAEELSLTPREADPQEIVSQALQARSRSISYTYTEPTIFFEYAYDIGKLAKEKGLYNVFVTNGYMTEEMIQKIHPLLDAANIDLKSFDDGYYRRVCKGRLAPVLKSIQTMNRLKIWVEVTTLVVPGLNDSEEDLGGIARFLADTDPSIPWHISRFYPQYEMADLESTPMKTLDRAYEIGKQSGLRYVYLGNAGRGNNTYCFGCGRLLIERAGFSVRRYDLKQGRCPDCGALLDGVWV